MPLTKIKRGGLDTGITDNSDANALTFDSSENATFGGNIIRDKITIDTDHILFSRNGSYAASRAWRWRVDDTAWGNFDLRRSDGTDNTIDTSVLLFNGADSNATFAGNITSNTGKFYAPANVNLMAYSRNTKVIEYDANHTINMSYAANVAGDLTVQNTSGAGNLTLHGDPATLLVDGVGSAYSVIAKGAGGNWGALSFCVGTNDNSDSTWWIGLDDDSGDDLHFANYQFGTSYLILDKSAGATFAGAVTTGGNLAIAPSSNTPYIWGGTVSTVFRNNANNASLITILNDGTVTFNGANSTLMHKIGNSTQTSYVDIQLTTNSGTGEIWKNGTGYTAYAGASGLNIYNSNGAIALIPNQIQSLTLDTSGNATFAGDVGIEKSSNPTLTFTRNEGTITDGEILGKIAFAGHESTPQAGAIIQGVSDGAWGTNDLNSRLEFYTTPDGSGDVVKRLTIDKDGNSTFTGVIRTSYNGDASVQVDSADGNDAYIDLASGSHNMTIRNTGGDSFGGLEFHYEGAEKMRLENNGMLVIARPNETAGDDAKLVAWASGTAGHAAISARAGGNSDGLHINAGNNNYGSNQYAIKVSDENSSTVVFGVKKSDTVENDDIYEASTKGSINIDGSGSHGCANDGKLYVSKNNSADWAIKCEAGNDNFGITTHGAGTYAFYASKHDVGATFRVHYDGIIYLVNTSLQSISDERLKENIVDANSQWDDIKGLKFRNYNWKDNKYGSKKYLGLIAQEVEQVSEGLVEVEPQTKEDMENGVENPEYKNVNYSIVWMKAVKALQEAMAKIETLEAKVTVLENA